MEKKQSDSRKYVKLKLLAGAGSIAGMLFLFLGGCLLVYALMAFAVGESREIALWLLVLSLILLAAGLVLVKKAGKADKAYKKMINPVRLDVIRSAIELDDFDEAGCFPEEMVKETGMYRNWNRFYGRNLLSGSYRNIPFRLCTLSMNHHTGRTGSRNSHTTTIFKGPFLEISCRRTLQGRLLLEERSLLEGGSGSIRIQNERFDKRFKVTAEAEEEALAVLTPQLQERILRADDYAESRTKMLFRNDKLYIALNNKRELFEGNMTMSLDAYREACEKDTEYLTGFLDILFGDTSLF